MRRPVPALLAAILAAGLVPFAAGAAGLQLVNLTPDGATIEDGNRACPDQPMFTYGGGKRDHGAGTPDRAYPSPNLLAAISVDRPVIAYDTRQPDSHFGDSFNLQNNRSVCYAIVEFATQRSGTPLWSNDVMSIGHTGTDMILQPVGQVIVPNDGASGRHKMLAFDQTGLGLLSALTGQALDKKPEDSILDVYLEDDTAIDYFRLYVWYGPNCRDKGRC